MSECENCGAMVDLTTDDNYNSDHSQWQCPECAIWHLDRGQS